MKTSRLGCLLLLLGALFPYLAGALPLLIVPLRADETEFVPQAQAILVRGVPKILFSEQSYIYDSEAWLIRYGADYGLWHPPVYLYLLALFQGLFGIGAGSARLLGLTTGVASMALVFFVTRSIAQAKNWDPRHALLAGFVACVMAGTNPFWTHGSLVVDIDNTILTVLALAFLSLFLAWQREFTPARSTLLGGVVMALLLAKPAVVPLLIAAVGLYCAANGDWKTSLRVGLATLGGAICFAVTWYVYAEALAVPWRFPLDFTYLGKRSFLGARSLFDVARVLRYNTAWMTLPFVALGLCAVRRTVRTWRRTGQVAPEGLFTILGSITVLFYSTVWTLLGKYTVMVVPLFAVPSGLLVGEWFAKAGWKGKRAALGAALFVGAVAYYALVVGDTVTAPAGQAGAKPERFLAALGDPRVARQLLGMIPVVLAPWLWWQMERRPGREFEPSLVAGLALLVLPAQLVQQAVLLPAAKQSHILTPRREAGFLETAQFLRSVLHPADVYAASKELAFHVARGRALTTDRDITLPRQKLGAALEAHRPRFIVWSDLEGDRPELEAYTRGRRFHTRQLGSYQVRILD